MGTLRVFVVVGSQATVVGSYSDNRGDVWNSVKITIRGVQPYQVNFLIYGAFNEKDQNRKLDIISSTRSLTVAFPFGFRPGCSRGKCVRYSPRLLSFYFDRKRRKHVLFYTLLSLCSAGSSRCLVHGEASEPTGS